MIGLSLSLCVNDILRGKVAEADVTLIIADTKADNAVEMFGLFQRYMESYWYNAPQDGLDIARRLLKAGKIFQPRLYSPRHEHNIAYGHWVVNRYGIGGPLLVGHMGELLRRCPTCEHFIEPFTDTCAFCELAL